MSCFLRMSLTLDKEEGSKKKTRERREIKSVYCFFLCGQQAEIFHPFGRFSMKNQEGG